jgi:hypothetical protein
MELKEYCDTVSLKELIRDAQAISEELGIDFNKIELTYSYDPSLIMFIKNE